MCVDRAQIVIHSVSEVNESHMPAKFFPTLVNDSYRKIVNCKLDTKYGISFTTVTSTV